MIVKHASPESRIEDFLAIHRARRQFARKRVSTVRVEEPKPTSSVDVLGSCGSPSTVLCRSPFALHAVMRRIASAGVTIDVPTRPLLRPERPRASSAAAVIQSPPFEGDAPDGQALAFDREVLLCVTEDGIVSLCSVRSCKKSNAGMRSLRRS